MSRSSNSDLRTPARRRADLRRAWRSDLDLMVNSVFNDTAPVIPNLNHLEVFCQVARHHGIAQAVRALRSGIGTQQSSISKKMQQLESDLGVQLFERQPFHLTPQGRLILERSNDLFAQLEQVCQEVRAGRQPPLRVAASEAVLRDYFPDVMADFNRRHPGICFSLETGFQAGIETRLFEGTIDFAITTIDETPRRGIEYLPIVKLPLVLVVPKMSPLKSAAQLWKQDLLSCPLITLEAHHAVTRAFMRGLREMRVHWSPQIVATSTPLLLDYVAAGQGFGISLAPPRPLRQANVRLLPLPGFDEVQIAALWRPPVNALLAALRAVVETQAALLGR